MKIYSLLQKTFSFLILCAYPFGGYATEAILLLKKGEEALDAALYQSAIKHLEEGLGLDSTEYKPIFKNRLIKAYYLNKEYLKVLDLSNSPPLQESESYFLGLSLKALSRFDEAFSCFSDLFEKHSNPLYLMEKGICAYYLKNLPAAADSLSKAVQLGVENEAKQVASLYLSRILLEQNLVEEAERLLEKFPLNGPFEGEIHYLLGEAAFTKKDYSLAISYFEKALPKFSYLPSLWHQDTLNYLVNSHLGLVEKNRELAYLQAIDKLKTLAALWPDDHTYLKLAKCLISFGELANDNTALSEANHYLSLIDAQKAPELKTEIAILKAQTQSTYQLKDKIYRQLMDQQELSDAQRAQIGYFKGMNEFEQAILAQKKGDHFYSDHLFNKALLSFQRAYELYIKLDPSWAVQCLIRSAQILTANQQANKDKAISLLKSFLEQKPSALASLPSQEEFLYLLALYAAHQSEEDQTNHLEYQLLAKSLLEKNLSDPLQISYRKESLMLLATLYFKEGQQEQAASLFSMLLKQFPESDLAPEALFWLAHCHEKQDILLARQKKLEFYQKYPLHPFAAEAYFRCYRYIDYLQGDRAAIKHLKAFPQIFEDSPFVLNAYYLLGLNSKRDRKSQEGRWIAKKDLIASTESFQQVHDLYNAYIESDVIPPDQLEYYTQLAIRSAMEKAQANLAIAEESEGTKRQIFLEYAENDFNQIYQNLENKEHPYSNYLLNKRVHFTLEAECLLYWAKTELMYQKEAAAEQLLDRIIEKYHEAKITKSYFLAKAWEEKGRLFLKNEHFEEALEALEHAQGTSKGRLYSDDQRLELGILKSHCFAGLNQLDQAILTLSKVINDEAVSSLRLKAMYLRSEIYLKQNRLELAKKQLEALAKQNGEWAAKARQKLEERYGL